MRACAQPKERGGRTAFHCACAAGRTDAVEALVAAGCQKGLLDGSGKTGRDLADDAGHADVLALLAALKKRETNRKKKEQKRRKEQQAAQARALR